MGKESEAKAREIRIFIRNAMQTGGTIKDLEEIEERIISRGLEEFADEMSHRPIEKEEVEALIDESCKEEFWAKQIEKAEKKGEASVFARLAVLANDLGVLIIWPPESTRKYFVLETERDNKAELISKGETLRLAFEAAEAEG